MAIDSLKTIRGARAAQAFPDLARWPRLEKLAATYAKLATEYQALSGRVRAGIPDEIAKTREDEQRKLADALRKGEPEPKSLGAKEQKLLLEQRALEQRVEALDLALDQTEQELILTLDELREDMLTDVDARLDELRAAYSETLDAAEAARFAYVMEQAVRGWAKSWPEGGTYRVRELPVRLLKPNGEPYSGSEVMGALREEAASEA
jgi:hypothetical protein